MKSEFAFIALPISALVAVTFAVEYLTVDQAQASDFSRQIVDGRAGKTGSSSTEKLSSKPSGVRYLHDEQQVWRVSGGGWFIVDEVVGKHEFITYAVGLNADGSVKQIEVMDYRETYGGEIRK